MFDMQSSKNLSTIFFDFINDPEFGLKYEEEYLWKVPTYSREVHEHGIQEQGKFYEHFFAEQFPYVSELDSDGISPDLLDWGNSDILYEKNGISAGINVKSAIQENKVMLKTSLEPGSFDIKILDLSRNNNKSVYDQLRKIQFNENLLICIYDCTQRLGCVYLTNLQEIALYKNLSEFGISSISDENIIELLSSRGKGAQWMVNSKDAYYAAKWFGRVYFFRGPDDDDKDAYVERKQLTKQGVKQTVA